MEFKGNVFTIFATTLGLCILYTSVNCEMAKGKQRTVPAVSDSIPVFKGKDIPHEIELRDEKVLLHQKFEEIVIAFEACGNRSFEAMVMMKSALVFSRSFIRFIIVADDNLIPFFNEKMNEWMEALPNKFTFEIHELKFPREDFEMWKQLSSPCTSQILFFPNMLSSVDALLYIDVESIILAPVEELWNIFGKMNSTQFIGMVQDSEDPNWSWYKTYSNIPYFGLSALNNAVMPMNLTRMREINWEEYVFQTYEKYKEDIAYIGQDILNIIFHFNPEMVYLFPCRYNFRSICCAKTSICPSALDEGIAVLRGTRNTFHKGPFQELQIVYKIMKEYQLGTDPYSGFFRKLKGYLENAEYTPCADNYDFPFTKAAEGFMNEYDHNA